MLSHTVFFWLFEDKVEAGQKLLLERARSDLRAIPGVLNLAVGKPIPSNRAVVDSSYHVGLSMQFETAAGLHNYQANPIHQKFIKECIEPYVSRLVVYDFDSEPLEK